MSSNTRIQLEEWLKTINVKCDRVLDIGGSQNPIKGRTKSWKVSEYKILDLPNPHVVKQTADFSCDVQDEYAMMNEVMVDKTFDNGVQMAVPKFEADVMFCLEVSEYWWNPREALENLRMTLRSDGILYISFHFVYPIHEPKEFDYLRYTEKGVLKLMEEARFEVLENKARFASHDSFFTLWDFYSKERMRPSKNGINHDIIGSLIKAVKK